MEIFSGQVMRMLTLLSLVLFGGLGGCASVGTKQLAAEVAGIAFEQRDHVWPIFLNSPLDRPGLGHLTSVAHFAHQAGFAHSTFMDWTSGSAIAEKVQQIKAADHGAKIVLIAWSGASLWAWDAAEIVAPKGIQIDSIIYLDSNWLKNRLAEGKVHPTNIGGTLLVYRQDNPLPEGVPRSRRVRIPTTDHLAVAAHPLAVEAVIHELVSVARGSGAAP